MKYKSLFFLLFVCGNVWGQLSSSISVLTQEQINKLETKDGTFLLNSTTQSINYVANGQWFSLSGECSPKPIAPTVDSCIEIKGEVRIFFKVQPQMSYLIEDTENYIVKTGNTNPLIFKLSELKTEYFVIRATNGCGKSSPSNQLSVKKK